MDWRGIEWAVPVFEIVMIVLPVYAFITFRRRIKRGVLEKSRALWRYASLVITPVILYVLFFFALVGFEELTHISVITEGIARTFLILVGLGLTIWIVSILAFGVALVFVKNQPSSPEPDPLTPSGVRPLSGLLRKAWIRLSGIQRPRSREQRLRR